MARSIRAKKEGRSNGVLVASNCYDHQGHRVRLVTQIAAHTFIYDGWNVVLELVEHDGVTDRIEYYWGRDLSGTLQGAGGVGGLLYLKRNGSIFVPIYDAFGNVMEYRAADGSLAAAYVYDSFGRTISQTGSLADAFRFRYSTKRFDEATGLYYYGKRFYSPELRRWLNRDWTEENGFNLYCIVGNALVFDYDVLGEKSAKKPEEKWKFKGSIREDHEWNCREWPLLTDHSPGGTANKYVAHFKISFRLAFGLQEGKINTFSHMVVSTLGMSGDQKSYWCLILDPLKLYERNTDGKLKMVFTVVKIDKHPCLSEKPEIPIKGMVGKTFTLGPL